MANQAEFPPWGHLDPIAIRCVGVASRPDNGEGAWPEQGQVCRLVQQTQLLPIH